MREHVARVTRRGGLEALALGLAALALYAWRLDRNGWANEYDVAAVRSTSTSWRAFWFASFDAAGIRSLDKPPFALSSGRTGARAVMAAVGDTCTAAVGDDAPAGLYDCSGDADALRAAA